MPLSLLSKGSFERSKPLSGAAIFPELKGTKMRIASTIRFIQILMLGLLTAVLNSAAVFAQDDDETEEGAILGDLANIWDFRRLSGADARLEPYGDDLMGDMIDKNTGTISFQHTDVSLPGNSGLEVAFRRKITQGSPYASPFQQGLEDWVLDLPIAHFQYVPEIHGGRDPVFSNGCLTRGHYVGHSIDVKASIYSVTVPPELHNSGVTLYVPGAGLSGRPERDTSKLHDPQANWILSLIHI